MIIIENILEGAQIQVQLLRLKAETTKPLREKLLQPFNLYPLHIDIFFRGDSFQTPDHLLSVLGLLLETTKAST